VIGIESELPEQLMPSEHLVLNPPFYSHKIILAVTKKDPE
jgi:hypothetical protein